MRALAAPKPAPGSASPSPTADLGDALAGLPHQEKPAPNRLGPTTSYRELHRLSGRTATWLVAMGLRKGDRVVIALAGALEYVAAYYGVLKAGAVAVWHNLDTRSAILGRCLEHSEARAIFLDTETLALLDGLWPTLTALEQVITAGPVPTSRPDSISITPFAVLAENTREIHDTSLIRVSLSYGQSSTTGSSHRPLVHTRSPMQSPYWSDSQVSPTLARDTQIPATRSQRA
jgi:acyl-CoA synthetase (AMP-forming)/AMP-acid ligase II